MLFVYRRLIFRSIGRYFCSTRNTATFTKPILYGDNASPPVRFVMMTASFLEIDLEFHKIDLFNSENKSEFYTKINPLQKVPAMKVGGDVICDSHAIALYLCQKSLNQDLYPKNILMKARVDEMLFFNATTLFPLDSFIFTEFFAGKWPANERKVKQWHTALKHLEIRLSKYQWLTGDKMRLSDICCATTISSLEVLVPVLQQYVLLKKWMENLECLPFFEINRKGLERLRNFAVVIKP